MKIPAHIIQHGNVAPIDFEPLLQWSEGVPTLLVAQEMFRGRGTIPDDWCLVALLRDDSKYLLEPETRLTRSDLERIASFHWLRPDLVAKLDAWEDSEFESSDKARHSTEAELRHPGDTPMAPILERSDKSLGDQLAAIHRRNEFYNQAHENLQAVIDAPLPAASRVRSSAPEEHRGEDAPVPSPKRDLDNKTFIIGCLVAVLLIGLIHLTPPDFFVKATSGGGTLEEKKATQSEGLTPQQEVALVSFSQEFGSAPAERAISSRSSYDLSISDGEVVFGSKITQTRDFILMFNIRFERFPPLRVKNGVAVRPEDTLIYINPLLGEDGLIGFYCVPKRNFAARQLGSRSRPPSNTYMMEIGRNYSMMLVRKEDSIRLYMDEVLCEELKLSKSRLAKDASLHFEQGFLYTGTDKQNIHISDLAYFEW